MNRANVATAIIDLFLCIYHKDASKNALTYQISMMMDEASFYKSVFSRIQKEVALSASNTENNDKISNSVPEAEAGHIQSKLRCILGNGVEPQPLAM